MLTIQAVVLVCWIFGALVSGTSRNLLQSQRETLCRAWVSVFQDTCSMDKHRFRGYVNQQHESLAICCRNDDCCRQLNGVIDAGCLELLEEEPEEGVLESIGFHATACSGTGEKMPKSLIDRINVTRVDSGTQVSDVLSQQSCESLSYEMITECGFLSSGSKFQFLKDGRSMECCHSSSCCHKAEQFYQDECHSGIESRHWTRRIGYSVAEIWKGACILDVAAPEGMDEQDAGTAVLKSTILEEEQYLPIQQAEVIGGEQTQTQGGQQENQQQCDNMEEVLEQLDVDAQTTLTFCQLPDISALPSFGNTFIVGCCNIVQQITEVLCEKQTCLSALPPFIDDELTLNLRNWQVVCNPSITSCPFVNALPNPYQTTSLPPFPPLQVALDQAHSTLQPNQTNFQNPQSVDLAGSNSNLLEKSPEVGPLETSVETLQQWIEQSSDNEPEIQSKSSSSEQSTEYQSTYIKINEYLNESMFDALQTIPNVLFFNLAVNQINLQHQIRSLNSKVMVFAALDSAFHSFAESTGMSTDRVIDNLRAGSLTDMIQQNVLTEFVDLDRAATEPVQGASLNGQYLQVSVDLGREEMWVSGCCEPENRARILSGSVFQEGLLAVVDRLVIPPSLVEAVFQD
eukprot:TRINITY_DN9935_c0_g1_i3.p1 TRINITY_DN9935_c0_g1~~TRINITY_DN9935_c0_g1_i3.p1  ORF type:complete len:628 (+),score=78.88 TRINITY_DN9935_c0_g1_i3:341-2224(+)